MQRGFAGGWLIVGRLPVVRAFHQALASFLEGFIGFCQFAGVCRFVVAADLQNVYETFVVRETGSYF